MAGLGEPKCHPSAAGLVRRQGTSFRPGARWSPVAGAVCADLVSPSRAKVDRRGPHPRYIDPTCQPQEEGRIGEGSSFSPSVVIVEEEGADQRRARRSGVEVVFRGAGWTRRRERDGGVVGAGPSGR
jgi:hypothetical protein